MEKNDSRKHFAARCALLLAGLAVMALGVALSIKAELGTSPISSVPYVSGLISGLSVGTTTIIVNSLFVLAQILMLRSQYDWYQLLQIPVAIVFGLMIDMFSLLMGDIVLSSYIQQWLFCAAGIIFVALGVSMEVTAELITTAGEGLVLAICQVTSFKFGNVKVAVDVTLVILAAAASLLVLGELAGVREGTAAAAVLVGLLTKQFVKPLNNVKQKLAA